MRRWRAATSALVMALAVAGCGGGSGAGEPAAAPGAQPVAWTYSHLTKDLSSSVVNVAAVSAHDAWAVALTPVAGNIDKQQVTLLRYDGSSWRPQTLPPGMAPAPIAEYRLEASSPRDVWLFRGGPNTGTYAAHFDGTKWQQTPAPAGVGDVAVLGPADVWAVGEGTTASHWNGSRWTSVPLPARVVQLAGVAEDDVWASGLTTGEEDGLSYGAPVVLHWDGNTWKREQLPAVEPPSAYKSNSMGASPMALYAPATDDVWAISRLVGDDDNGDAVYAAPFAFHWNGTRWSKTSPDACRRCGIPAGDGVITADGMEGDNAGSGMLLSSIHHRATHGKSRRIGPPPAAAGRSGKVTAVDRKQKLRLVEITSVPGTDRVWGVGSLTVEAHGDANFSRGVIVQYDPHPRD
ncbi:hypothetical protein ACFVDQ_36265 [Streptomyces sp. NPDC057684]|uniref:hypothetical protein n=1 Tax=Streptomyces sp. NPDC057684 TaxID=3346211 RepID=UPI003697E741